VRRPETSAIMTAMGGPIELNGIRLRNRLH